MTIHEALFSPVRQPLLGILYLLLALQMALFLAAFREGRSHRVCLGIFLHLLLSFALLCSSLLDIAYNPFRTDMTIPLPPARSAVTTLPVRSLFLYESLTALILLAAFRDLQRWRRHHLTFESIKEAMDLLPAGIAFGRPDGTVVFSNLAMNELSHIVTGKGLTDLSALWNNAGSSEETTTEAERQPVLQAGSSLWQLTSQSLDVEGETYLQLTAADITEEAAIMRQLEEKNGKLRDIHMRLNLYNQHAEKLIIAQELLTARMTVHNELGSVLLECRHYLTDPPAIREEILLQALKNANTYLLREYEQDDTQPDPLSDSLELAAAIGVHVEWDGAPPEKEPWRGILAAAITECATNTIKHADGDTLSVTVRDTCDEFFCSVTGNGIPPKKQVIENGGLLSLRALVENENGTMQLDSMPQVKLIIRMQKIKKNNKTDGDDV